MGDIGGRESIRNNRGFSLIELMVSIAIIGLLLLPILNSFVVAARSNLESRNVQVENDIVQSIMEEMKSGGLEDIIIEYNMVGDECYEASVSGLGYDLYHNNPYSMKDSYYLLKRDINNKYDALITLDASAYYISPGIKDTDYNKYKMPLVREVDSGDHLVAIQSYETEMAVAVLYSKHVDACGGAMITPESFLDIENSIARTISIDISQSAGSIHAIVRFDYSSTHFGCGSVSYQLEAKNLSSSAEGIYVFYEAFHTDAIEIVDSTGQEIDVFIYEQTGTLSAIPLNKPSNVMLYTNLNLEDYEPVKKEEAKNRIFDIRVQLFRTTENFDFDDLYIPGELYTELQSTRGE